VIKTEKLVICVCPTGSWLMKNFNPNVPIQPGEIAEEVYRSWNEGASIVSYPRTRQRKKCNHKSLIITTKKRSFVSLFFNKRKLLTFYEPIFIARSNTHCRLRG
jgi:hypothetical protein